MNISEIKINSNFFKRFNEFPLPLSLFTLIFLLWFSFPFFEKEMHGHPSSQNPPHPPLQADSSTKKYVRVAVRIRQFLGSDEKRINRYNARIPKRRGKAMDRPMKLRIPIIDSRPLRHRVDRVDIPIVSMEQRLFIMSHRGSLYWPPMKKITTKWDPMSVNYKMSFVDQVIWLKIRLDILDLQGN